MCEQFGLSVFPSGELCVNEVPAVMTGVYDTECQCFLHEHMSETRGMVFIVLRNGSVLWKMVSWFEMFS